MGASRLSGPSETSKLPSYISCSGGEPVANSTVLRTGYGNHGDYVFGWKDDALQKIMDEECYVNCKSMKTQSIQAMNSCSVKNKVDEDIGDNNCMSSPFRGCFEFANDVLGIAELPGVPMAKA
jgi:hypothetical protein